MGNLCGYVCVEAEVWRWNVEGDIEEKVEGCGEEK